MLLVGGAAAALLAVAAPSSACPLASPPAVVCTPPIQEAAERLGGDPVRIYEFVRNEFGYEPYFGLLKGPEGTLRSRSGNDYDLAALLVSMLRASGFEARFASSRIALTETQATGWIGTTSGAAAQAYVSALEPGWAAAPPSPWQGELARTTWDGTTLQTEHVWVEARVPMARYRGNAAGGAPATSWISLDPSFKLRQKRPGIALPFDGDPGTDPELSLQYTGPGGLYSRIDPRNPREVFEEQVQGYLARNHPGATLDDVSPNGAILTQAPGVLPAALPYALVDPTIVRRHTQLDTLWTDPSSYRQSLRIAVCEKTFASAGCRNLGNAKLQDPTSPQPGLVLVFETPSAAAEGRRITLTFPPDDPTSLSDAGYAALDCAAGPSTIAAKVRVAVDGVDATNVLIVEDPNATFPVCEELRVVASMQTLVIPPGQSQPLALTSGGKVLVGSTVAPAIAFQSESGLTTAMVAERLVQVSKDYPVAPEVDASGNPTGKVFVDDDPAGAPGAKDPSEQYLGRHFEAQEALLGSVLQLAATRWGELRRVHRDRTFALFHRLPSYLPGVGLVSAQNQLDYLFDSPVGIDADGFLIDLQAQVVTNWDLDGTPHDLDELAEVFGHAVSASEHEVWEEILGVDAISTVRGLQIASALGIELLTLHGAAEAEAELATRCDNTLYTCDSAKCGNSGPFLPGSPRSAVTGAVSGSTYVEGGVCSGVDFDTYCELRRRFGPARNTVWMAPYWDAYDCNVNPSGTTQEIRIPAHSYLRYRDWEGPVYYARQDGLLEYKIAPNGEPLGGAKPFDRPIRQVVPPLAKDVFYFAEPAAVEAALQGVGVLFPAEWVEAGRQQMNLHPDLQERNAAESLEVTAGDPVSVVSGDLYHLEVDIDIPGPGGHGLRMVRSYNSQLAYAGPFGYGWTHTYDQHLRIENATGNPPDRRVVRVREDGGEIVFRPDGAGGLAPNPWVRDDLTEHPDGSFTLTTKQGMIYRYAAPDSADLARILEIEDRNGNRIQVNRPVDGPLQSVCETAGTPPRCLTFGYAAGPAPGDTSTTIAWAGQTWRYVVDSNGDLVEYWDPVQTGDPDGRPVLYTYLADQANPSLDHNMESWSIPSELVSVHGDPPAPGSSLPACTGAAGEPDCQLEHWTMTYAYYGDDRVRAHTDSAGRTTTFSYSIGKNRTWATYADGSTESWVFDALGKIIRHESPGGVLRLWEYDPTSGDQLLAVDGLGHATAAAYDAQGNMIRRTDRLGHTESWTYGPFGLPTSHVDRRGHERRWEYDAHGNLLREWATLDGRLELLRELAYDNMGNVVADTVYQQPGGAGPAVTRFQYDPTGSVVVRTTDALGHDTRFTPDALGRIVRTERLVELGDGPAQLVATETDYDEVGRVRMVRDASGVETHTTYLPNGLVQEVRTVAPSPGGPIERTDLAQVYDAAGQLLHTTDALGATTTFAYDGRGRRIRTTSPLGSVTTEAWDGDGRRVRMVDPSGARWRWSYVSA